MDKTIKAGIIADSINQQGNRVTTYILTYHRIIHAELLTHRLFSRNAASSRAIPAKKMIKMIEEDPFIPIAWQKAHKGMQGTEYITDPELIKIERDEWLKDVNYELESAKKRISRGITKQLINRRLEDAQWYTVILTATEYDNFFELRCPQYKMNVNNSISDSKEVWKCFKSKKDYNKALLKYWDKTKSVDTELGADFNWYSINKSEAEIHIQALAEAMWDARNESTPKLLQPGQWHIPFGDKFDRGRLNKAILQEYPLPEDYDFYGTAWTSEQVNKVMVKIATARCARISYNNFEGKDDYLADLKLHDRLASSGHWSPFEHCAQAMTDEEYYTHVRGQMRGGYEKVRDKNFKITNENQAVIIHEHYPKVYKTEECFSKTMI